VKKALGFLFLLITGAGSFSLAKNKSVQFATFEVPPFFTESLPEQGAAAMAMKESFKKMGYDVRLAFMPINRTKAETLRDSKLMGFLPCSENDLIKGYVLSKTVFQTKTLIIERADLPITWNKPEDLAKYRGGSVVGYSIKSPIREIVKKAKLQIEESPDDISNLLKLANKRIDYVFIAGPMYEYFMKVAPPLKDVGDKIRPNAKPVTTVNWGIAFKKASPKSRLLMEEFNTQLNEEEFRRNVGIYFSKMNKPAVAAVLPVAPSTTPENPVPSPSPE
jgi:polar amino acid transport system substrate-binding protein